MPWLTFEEICEFESGLTIVEFEAIRAELLDESLNLIQELAADLSLNYDEETAARMRKEMVRSMMLFSGCMPDEVDFEHLHNQEVPDERWHAYLAIKPGEPEC